MGIGNNYPMVFVCLFFTCNLAFLCLNFQKWKKVGESGFFAHFEIQIDLIGQDVCSAELQQSI